MQIIRFQSHTRKTAWRYAWIAGTLFALIVLIAVFSRHAANEPI